MQSERRLLESRIKRLMISIPRLEDDELRAELTKYLCVLASGLLEVSCREILSRYANPRCSPQIHRFVDSRLADLLSAKVGNVHQLLTNFDPMRAEQWLKELSDEEKDSVDSIVNNRHQIAHGRSIGLSFDVLSRYHTMAQKALAAMEHHFPPHKGP